MTNPIVSTITPDASTVGARIKVTGSNLDSVTKATVGGVDSTFEHVTDAILIVVVPAGARTGAVLVSNEDGPAGTAPLFTVTVTPKPRVETNAEKAARELFEAEQKTKADAEAASQRANQEAEKTAGVTHHDRVEHRDEQIARDQQQWPNQGQPWSPAGQQAPSGGREDQQQWPNQGQPLSSTDQQVPSGDQPWAPPPDGQQWNKNKKKR
jgi:hypothetical protein